MPYRGAIGHNSQWSRHLLTLAHLAHLGAVGRSSREWCSHKSSSSDALHGRQWLTGWAKNGEHWRALPGIYTPRKVIQPSGCPVPLEKSMFSRLSPAAEQGKACPCSTHRVCSGISLGMQALWRLALKGWLCLTFSVPDHLLVCFLEVAVTAYRK